MSDGNPENFDVLNVSLTEINLVGAAAGTGKTFSLAVMVLRWILETGNPIDSVVAVTFTNYATAELKERILNFLEKALFCLKNGSCDDEIITEICRKADRKEAKKRLSAAINDFDTAPIFTIHGFCRKIIQEHAFELGIDFNMELSEKSDTDYEAALAFFRKNITAYGNETLLKEKNFRQALSVQKLRSFISTNGTGQNGGHITVSGPRYPEELERIYSELAKETLDIIRERREKSNVMGFNDILLIIYEVLQDEKSARKLVESMENRYSLVLIDEFQDTDPLQYFIFSTLFCNGKHTVFFIGDPKQSIYSFRKADIFTYFEAANVPGLKKYEMKTNFRSSSAAVQATNKVFGVPDSFGDDELIPYGAVTAKNSGDNPLKKCGEPSPGLLLREVPDGNKDKVRDFVSGDISARIREMTDKDSPYRIFGKKEENGGESAGRAVVPSDIAVLVTTNEFAMQLCKYLVNDGIDAVVEADTVKELYIFATGEAEAVQKVMAAAATQGMAEFKAVLLTFFYNMTVEDISGDESALTLLHEEFLADFSEWEKKGFSYVFSQFIGRPWVLGNIAPEEKRRVPILRQLSELILKYELKSGFSMFRTQKWFAEKMSSKKDCSEEDCFRAESNSSSVRIMTLHKSKGLEFNIVFFPFMTSDSSSPWTLLHKADPSTGGKYTREMLYASDKASRRAGEKSIGEGYGVKVLNDSELEQTREIYVGLTRAKYMTVFYTKKDKKGKREFLSSLSVDGGSENFVRIDSSTESYAYAADQEQAGEQVTPVLYPPETAGRHINADWTLSSFSGIISSGQSAGEPDADRDEDAASADSAAAPDEPRKEEDSVPMSLFPRGTEAGTTLHLIFEKAGFASDNADLVSSVLKKKMNFRKDDLKNAADAVNRCLESVCTVPMFENGKTLRNLDESGEKAAEMEFYAEIRKDARKGQLAAVIKRCYEAGKILCDEVKKGFLHGFIDLVAKIDGKYYIIDWKSNNLGDHFSDYSPENIRKEMKKHDYYLQYMLYLAAFDRYMETFDKEYSYDRDFGGVRYVFLRGVQENSAETGIYADKPALETLRQFQELFGDEA